jgi:hypothetical protein
VAGDKVYLTLVEDHGDIQQLTSTIKSKAQAVELVQDLLLCIAVGCMGGEKAPLSIPQRLFFCANGRALMLAALELYTSSEAAERGAKALDLQHGAGEWLDCTQHNTLTTCHLQDNYGASWMQPTLTPGIYIWQLLQHVRKC